MNNFLGYAVIRKQARCALLESWLSSGSICLMDGNRRFSPESAVTSQNILATISLPNVSGSTSNGTFTGILPENVVVSQSGTVTWAIVKDSLGNPIFDCDVGIYGSGAVIQLTNVNLSEGGVVSIRSFSLSEG